MPPSPITRGHPSRGHIPNVSGHSSPFLLPTLPHFHPSWSCGDTRKIPRHRIGIRDSFHTDRPDHSLRASGFETVKHAGLGDGRLQEIHHQACKDRSRDDGRAQINANAQRAPSRIGEPVVQTTADAHESTGNGGGQWVPLLYAKIAKPISAPSPCMMSTIREPPTPHWLPMVSSIAAARVSANSAAPGLRTMMAARGPANSQKALSGPSKPGVTASKMANGAVQTMSQPQKITTMRRR